MVRHLFSALPQSLAWENRSMRVFLTCCLLAILPSKTFASGNCYSLYDGTNRLVLQSANALVDLSRSVSEQVALVFPGHHLVVAPNPNCAELDEFTTGQKARVPMDGPQRMPSQSPVLNLADEQDVSLPSTYKPSSMQGNRRYPGHDVQVRSHQRANGAVVQSYSRSAPGRGR